MDFRFLLHVQIYLPIQAFPTFPKASSLASLQSSMTQGLEYPRFLPSESIQTQFKSPILGLGVPPE